MIYCPVHEPGQWEPHLLPVTCDRCQANYARLWGGTKAYLVAMGANDERMEAGIEAEA